MFKLSGNRQEPDVFLVWVSVVIGRENKVGTKCSRFDSEIIRIFRRIVHLENFNKLELEFL